MNIRLALGVGCGSILAEVMAASFSILSLVVSFISAAGGRLMTDSWLKAGKGLGLYSWSIWIGGLDTLPERVREDDSVIFSSLSSAKPTA